MARNLPAHSLRVVSFYLFQNNISENNLFIIKYCFIIDKSKNVFQIYKEKFIMAQVLPEYLSEWTTKKAEAEGVRTIPNTEVQDYKYKKDRLFLTLTDRTVC